MKDDKIVEALPSLVRPTIEDLKERNENEFIIYTKQGYAIENCDDLNLSEFLDLLKEDKVFCIKTIGGVNE